MEEGLLGICAVMLGLFRGIVAIAQLGERKTEEMTAMTEEVIHQVQEVIHKTVILRPCVRFTVATCIFGASRGLNIFILGPSPHKGHLCGQGLLALLQALSWEELSGMTQDRAKNAQEAWCQMDPLCAGWRAIALWQGK